MMKKTIFSLLLLLLTAATLSAQQPTLRVATLPVTQIRTQQPLQVSSRFVGTAPRQSHAATLMGLTGLSSTQRPLGYAVGDSITYRDVMFGEAGTYTLGALLTPSQLAPYAGCTVVGIRFALSQSDGRIRVFLAQQDANGLYDLFSQTQRTYEGWNNVFFNGTSTYQISGNETLFFGFDYEETADMVAADRGALATYGNTDSDNAFLFRATTAQGDQLYPVSGAGYLCVQLIIDVSSLPEKELSFSYLDTGFRYKQAGENIDFLSILNNTGRSQVDRYVVGCQIDNDTPVYYEETVATSSKPNGLQESESDYFEHTFSLPADIAVGQHTFTLFVQSVDGQPQERHLSDTVRSEFLVYAHPVARQKHIVEVYNHEQSPYVPYNDPCFESLLQARSNVCLVNVAAPGTQLAVDEANYLHELYAYTYPSFTIDRSYFPGEAYIAYDMNDYVVNAAEIVKSFLPDMIDQEDYIHPAFATVDVQPTYDGATRELTLDVSGTLSEDAVPLFGDLALTVLLTEDHVVSRQMVYNERLGGSTWNSNYEHNHVLRTFATAPTGQRLTVAQGTYATQCRVTLADDWQAENMTVVAFVTRAADVVTDDNVMGMDLTGANSVSLKDVVASGIQDIAADATPGNRAATLAGDGVYDLQGRRLAATTQQLPRGLYVVRQGGKTTKIMVK